MGKTGKEIEELTGVRQNRASEIWKAYQREGEAALEVNRGGRPEGSGRILLPEEEAEIRETILLLNKSIGNRRVTKKGQNTIVISLKGTHKRVCLVTNIGTTHR